VIAPLGLAFLAGILSTLSPCVIPLIPLVLGAALSEHKLGPAALAAGCPCRKSDPTVFMMEPAEDGLCNHVTKPVDRTRKRRVLSQSEMRPDMVCNRQHKP